MKKMAVTLFGVLISLAGISAHADQFADGQWHKVLSCDGAVIDNEGVISRGGWGTGAQVVIRDQNALTQLRQAGVEIGFVDNQWIGRSFYMLQNPGNLVSFTFTYLDGQVTSDSHGGIYVQIAQTILNFHNCVVPQ